MIQIGQIRVFWPWSDLIKFGPTVVEETKHALHHALFHSSGTSESVGHWRVADIFEHRRSSNVFSQLIRECVFTFMKSVFVKNILQAEYPLAFGKSFPGKFC